MKFDEANALARTGATPTDNPENVTLTPKEQRHGRLLYKRGLGRSHPMGMIIQQRSNGLQ